ncbi:hypothetical protein GCM10009639_02360 [Kitasatospora putterlickiae]|uniref:OmpR/PhoB-type domain-containing protein n=1 Tax=Kitasatospora putterlickiae TaxID=221725 RepID=A0ABP4IB52_9ACTN
MPEDDGTRAARTPDGRVHVDFYAKRAVADGRTVELTYGDCRLLLALIAQGEEFRSHQDLGLRVWNHSRATRHDIGVRLAYLRAKLGPEWIETSADGHRLGRPPLPPTP